MNDLKAQFKKQFDKLDIPSEREEILKNQIIDGYKKKQRNKKVVFSILIVFSGLLLGTGIIYAKDIKANIDKIVTKISERKNSQGILYKNYKIESDARKELNYDAKLEEPKCDDYIDNFTGITEDNKCYTLYTYDELESELGIKLLKNDLFERNKFILKRVSRINGKISFIELQIKNPMNAKMNSSETTYITMSVYMLTKYHKSKNNKLWEFNDTSDGIHEYYIKNLDTTAHGTGHGHLSRYVFLVYDDIIYKLRIKAGGENVKYPDKEVQRILDSFHY